MCKVNKLDHIAGHGVDSNLYCEFALLTVATCEVWPLLGKKLKGPFNDVFFEYIHHVLIYHNLHIILAFSSLGCPCSCCTCSSGQSECLFEVPLFDSRLQPVTD